MGKVKYPLGTSRWEKIMIAWWRFRGCDHDTQMHLDVGDEDHRYMYCFRCGTKT